MKKEVEFIKRDATIPVATGNKVIVHVCNDIGGWGKGFVMAISAKWKQPEEQYRVWYQSKENFQLGEVQFVKVEEELWIANMIGQRKINKDENGNPPIRYEAVEMGLKKIAVFAQEMNASVHMQELVAG